ncbi:MAG: VWA domain-containing protein [Alphaproteobacteria bacterium]|nr:VWA domain-containing protein [Alphaproteobacteria bacterium]
MTEFVNNFHFLRPWVLLLILVPLLFYGSFFNGAVVQSSWQKVIDKRLLDYLLIKGSAVKRKVFVNVGLLGLLSAIIAAAGPSWQKIEVATLNKQNPVMIVLNLSSDISATDLKPSRLERAKYKIKDFLKLLKDVQVGLEVYSSEPFIIAPFTEDNNIILNLLPQVGTDIMPVNGDRLDRAIDLAVKRIYQAGYDGGNLLILTPDIGQKFDKALSAAENACKQGVSVNIIGMGMEENEKLSMTATKGCGVYWNLQENDMKIDMLAEEINQKEGKIDQSDNSKRVWLDAGYLLLGLPLICCLLFFRKGLLVVLFVMWSSSVWAGFFLNADQEGLNSFNNAAYEDAAQTFKNKNWQAASLYRAGKFDKAAQIYAADKTAEGLYNFGNALAKSGKIDEAITKYEEVLKQNPDHEDAKFNLEYLKKQQQQNQQNQQQNQNNQNNKDKNQQEQNQQQNQDENQNNENRQQNSNQNNSGNENNQNEQQNQNAQQQDNGEQNKNSDNEDQKADQNRQSMSEQELDETKENKEGKQSWGTLPQQNEEQKDYDEKMQTKMQQYRDIPEDPGGLLKAFIYQEYRQNRYQEE